MIDIRLLLFIALILLSTKAMSMFMKRLHLPQVVGALVAGVLLGPAVLNLVEPNETISVIAEFGVIFLLFAAGMETDFRQLRKSLKSSLLISVLGVAVALGGGFLVAFLFGNPTFESFFVGVIIASMSTSITVEALNEMGKLKTKVGTALMGASLFDDVLVIVILALVMGMGGGGFSIGILGITLLRIAAFFALAVIAGIIVNKFFNWFYGRFGNRGKLAIFAIAYCFLMAYLAEMLGLADITGAYLAGIAFCSTRCVEMLEEKTHQLSYLFFTPVFLANIGIHTSFDGMTGSLIAFTAVLAVVAAASKFVGCGLGAVISRFTKRECVQIGVGMIARGEVSFIVAAKGIAVGYMSGTMYPSVIVVVLVTVFITPLLLKVAFKNRDGGGHQAVDSGGAER
ncbi:MAG: cation:proton antiporter [Oscillospiraceae bacterium]|nr:cation:proton antiporter [Oscillospiraceae bacterium]